MSLEQEFMKAYDDHADAIFRFCYFRVFDRERARDTVQDAYFRTWEYARAGHKIDNWRAFLYRTARNLIIDQSRRKKMESLETLQEQGFEPSIDELEKIETGLDAEMLTERLRELKDEEREIITLRYIQDMSVGEIAALLGERDNTVSVRIHRAIGKLKRLVKK